MTIFQTSLPEHRITAKKRTKAVRPMFSLAQMALKSIVFSGGIPAMSSAEALLETSHLMETMYPMRQSALLGSKITRVPFIATTFKTVYSLRN